MCCPEKMSFHDIEVNHTDLEQSYLNIEDRSRVNPFSWTGQFSPQFIEVLLDRYSNENDVVFDPFSGSGTVLIESVRKKLSAIGVELNPSAYYMSKFYEITCLTNDKRDILIDTIDSFVSSLLSSTNVEKDYLNYYEKMPDGTTKNTVALLLIMTDVYKNDFDPSIINLKWIKIKNMIYGLPHSNKPIKSYLGDIRNTNLLEDSASLLITSPPYINVFNYHQNYRRSVEKLGYNILQTAKSEFGSNRKNRGNRFLTVIQYCIDMALAIKECIRICKNGSRMIFVVGKESNVLSTCFCNSELIFKIEKEIFGLSFIMLQERSFKNRFGQIIYEDILHFNVNNESKTILSENYIIEESKKIALCALNKALLHADNDKKILLEQAIAKCNSISKSEVQ